MAIYSHRNVDDTRVSWECGPLPLVDKIKISFRNEKKIWNRFYEKNKMYEILYIWVIFVKHTQCVYGRTKSVRFFVNRKTFGNRLRSNGRYRTLEVRLFARENDRPTYLPKGHRGRRSPVLAATPNKIIKGILTVELNAPTTRLYVCRGPFARPRPAARLPDAEAVSPPIPRARYARRNRSIYARRLGTVNRLTPPAPANRVRRV